MEIEGTIISQLELSPTGISIISSKDSTNLAPEILGLLGSLLYTSTKEHLLDRFLGTTDGLIFLKVDQQKLLGFIQTEHRRILYKSASGSVKELNPLCVIDFQVFAKDEEKHLFEAVLLHYFCLLYTSDAADE